MSPLKFWYVTLLAGYLAQEDAEPEPEGEPEPELGWLIFVSNEDIKKNRMLRLYWYRKFGLMCS